MLTGLWVMLPVLNWSQGGAAEFDYHQLVLVPSAYVIGLLPALLTAGFDGVLTKLGVRFRPLWCALFGFAAAFIPLLGALSMGFLHGPLVASFGLLGAAPAAACSWLSRKWAPPDRPREAAP
jgi:hypothetical protein